MSTKAEVLVVRKILVGEWDLLALVYGTVGKAKLLVRKGFHPNSAYCSIFEPFNLMIIDYHQSGDLLILNDVKDVKFYSYLALRSYSRFLWMSKVVQNVVKWISYYDSSIFNLLKDYLILNIRNHKVFEIKLKLELVKSMGIYKEDVFEANVRQILNRIANENSVENLEGVFLSEAVYRSINEALEGLLKELLD